MVLAVHNHANYPFYINTDGDENHLQFNLISDYAERNFFLI